MHQSWMNVFQQFISHNFSVDAVAFKMVGRGIFSFADNGRINAETLDDQKILKFYQILHQKEEHALEVFVECLRDVGATDLAASFSNAVTNHRQQMRGANAAPRVGGGDVPDVAWQPNAVPMTMEQMDKRLKAVDKTLKPYLLMMRAAFPFDGTLTTALVTNGAFTQYEIDSIRGSATTDADRISNMLMRMPAKHLQWDAFLASLRVCGHNGIADNLQLGFNQNMAARP